ncbi:hypothetical protein MARG145_0535 [Mycoplasmopsis arginini]|nr:Hypothetical protein, predicted transmembrane protein [Mycoplasmopsis arginini 7264]BAQ54515.1 hypothetical protein MARG145_0535 [Mycoplasmopsis arginini]
MMKNKIKYSSSLVFSMIGSEGFKLATAVYIYKFTSSFWLVSLLYLLIQVPTFISYLLNKKITERWKLKNILFICDLLSLSILAIILISSFFVIKQNTSPGDGNTNSYFVFSIFLLVINVFLNIIHSFRFVALKSIIYYLSSNKKDIKTYNFLTVLLTSTSILLGVALSFVLFSKLPFWSIIVFNMITYLISGILYFKLKPNAKALNTTAEIEQNKIANSLETVKIQTKRYIKNIWIYTIACSFIIGIFLFPRTVGMSQFFNEIKFEASKSSFVLNISFAAFGFAGSLISFLIKDKNIKLIWILIPINLLFIMLMPILFSNMNNVGKNIFYLLLLGIQQFFFSLFLAIFYTNSYLFFKEQQFKQNTIYTLIFRIISSSLVIILLTLITIKLGYFISFLFFALFIISASIVISITEYKIYKYRKKWIDEDNLASTSK